MDGLASVVPLTDLLDGLNGSRRERDFGLEAEELSEHACGSGPKVAWLGE
jgi:hypothetical protein